MLCAVSYEGALPGWQELLAGRGQRLLLYFDGYWDEHEHGILDGLAPLELLAEKPLTEDQRAQVGSKSDLLRG